MTFSKYALLAMYMPLSILTALVFLLNELLPVQFPFLPVLISGGICALAAALYCDLIQEDGANRKAANVRGGLIIMGIIYLVSSLFRWELFRWNSWGRRFVPGVANISASVGALYVWVSVIGLKQFFNARKRIEAYIASYQGDQLHKALYDDPALVQYIDGAISSTKREYLAQLILIGVITFICVLIKPFLPLPLYVLLITILASWMCIFGFFGIIRWEYYCAAEGMSFSAFDRERRMMGIAILSALAIIAAILLASDKSSLHPSFMISFFIWIKNLFQWLIGFVFSLFGLLFWLIGKLLKGDVKEEPAPIETNTIPSFPDMGGDPWPIWRWLKYGVIVLVAAGFIWFMISPLLNRGGEKLTSFQKLRRIFAEWFSGTLTRLASFILFLKNGRTPRKLRRPGADEIRQAAATILGAYSQAQKRNMRRSATLFAQLIIWGGEVRHVIWKPVYAPGEYCGILAAAPDEIFTDVTQDTNVTSDTDVKTDNKTLLQRRNKGIIRCGELFEQALYSTQGLSAAEQKEFKDLVEAITGD